MQADTWALKKEKKKTLGALFCTKATTPSWKSIGSPEAKLVHGDGEVSRLVVAVVEVAVVHGDQVHVAEDEAVVLGVL